MPEANRPRRGPGPAVLLILVYGLLFLAALWAIWLRSPVFHRDARPPAARTAPR